MESQAAKGNTDRRIAEVAARQHGVVTTGQLLSAGIYSSGISNRRAAGRLHRIHRGVYAVGHPNIGNEGRWMAAVLACGDGAVLSHCTAALLWRMLPVTPGAERRDYPIDVTLQGGNGRKSRPGIRIHRSTTLSLTDCTRRRGIPVTTPARTLEDLRRVLPDKQFAKALREAEYLGLAIDSAFKTDRTRTELEARFMALVRRHRLQWPEVNVRVDRFEVDFLWRPRRLIVEVDGWESHRTRSAFEEDRARDARLQGLGYQVLRFTWRQIENDPREVARTIRALLAGASQAN
jgi:very-short-patch-repair endonuclease